jgi:hypothetical protein
MFLADKKLATFILTYNGVGIRHGGEPEDTLSILLTHE